MKEQLMEVKGMSYEACMSKARHCVSEGYIPQDEMVSYARHLYETHNNAQYNGGVQLL